MRAVDIKNYVLITWKEMRFAWQEKEENGDETDHD